ncbi:hypothetical protein JTE90_003549 [Oedothorax gibbosus]|uniref:Uncharacterized protein n=1 Tax=Oedothorax gibbosus TaxID=931172 RepID=A0AAV6VKV8_9ARAC|nr:hypothetical protein JTE90_003549 [Oedothorax gibbosus]
MATPPSQSCLASGIPEDRFWDPEKMLHHRFLLKTSHCAFFIPRAFIRTRSAIQTLFICEGEGLFFIYRVTQLHYRHKLGNGQGI